MDGMISFTMSLPIELKQLLVDLKYPLIGAMNDNQVANLFNEKNILGFLSWYISKLTENSCMFSSAEVSEYLLNAGVCPSSEVQLFVSGKLPHRRMMNILLAMLSRLKQLDEAEEEDVLESIDNLMEELEDRILSLGPADPNSAISSAERREQMREIERKLDEEAKNSFEEYTVSEEVSLTTLLNWQAFKPDDITTNLKDFQSVLPRLISTQNIARTLPDATSRTEFSSECIKDLDSCYRNGKSLEDFVESCQTIQRFRNEMKLSSVDELKELTFINRVIAIIENGKHKTSMEQNGTT